MTDDPEVTGEPLSIYQRRSDVPDRHRHRYRGQLVDHAHPGGHDSHGFFQHPAEYQPEVEA